MKYIVDDRNLTPGIFIPFVNQIWKGEYDTLSISPPTMAYDL